MEWLFVESTHLQDIGCQNLVLGDVIPATMRGAVATTTVHLSIPQKCIVEISGRVREERFGRLICDLEDHGTMPVEVRQPSGKSPPPRRPSPHACRSVLRSLGGQGSGDLVADQPRPGPAGQDEGDREQHEQHQGGHAPG